MSDESSTPVGFEEYLDLPPDGRKRHPLHRRVQEVNEDELFQWLLPYLQRNDARAMHVLSANVSDKRLLYRAVDLALAVADLSTLKHWFVELGRALGYRRLVAHLLHHDLATVPAKGAVVYWLDRLIPPEQQAARRLLEELRGTQRR